ncbi:hypothetical protein [Paracoccus sp. 22332]|uniref:hypothetical protein n=1 Tax=Paracoccus sp. 22332 TaxID=3453913 RepID=UPI003F85E586
MAAAKKAEKLVAASEPAIPDLVPIDVAAGILTIGPERVRQLIKSGHVPRGPRGKVNLVAAIQGYVAFLKEAAEKAAQPPSRERINNARERQIELLIAKEERALIPIEDAIMAMDKVVGVTNAELSGLPARITRDMGIRRKAEAEVHGVRKRISDALAKMSGAARTGIGLDGSGRGGDA